MITNWKAIDEMLRSLKNGLSADLEIKERKLGYYNETTYTLTENESKTLTRHVYTFRRPQHKIGSSYRLTIADCDSKETIVRYNPWFLSRLFKTGKVKIKPRQRQDLLEQKLRPLTRMYSEFEIRIIQDLIFETKDIPTTAEQILKTTEIVKGIKACT